MDLDTIPYLLPVLTLVAFVFFFIGYATCKSTHKSLTIFVAVGPEEPIPTNERKGF